MLGVPPDLLPIGRGHPHSYFGVTDPKEWTPPDPRGHRHADLQTVDAWSRKRRQRRADIVAAAVLLAATIGAWAFEATMGTDAVAEFRTGAAVRIIDALTTAVGISSATQ